MISAHLAAIEARLERLERAGRGCRPPRRSAGRSAMSAKRKRSRRARAVRLSPIQSALLCAIGARMNPGETFLAATILAAASGEPSFAALIEPLAPSGPGQALRLGRAMSAMAGVPSGGKVLRRTTAKEHGSALWTVELT